MSMAQTNNQDQKDLLKSCISQATQATTTNQSVVIGEEQSHNKESQENNKQESQIIVRVGGDFDKQELGVQDTNDERIEKDINDGKGKMKEQVRDDEKGKMEEQVRDDEQGKVEEQLKDDGVQKGQQKKQGNEYDDLVEQQIQKHRKKGTHFHECFGGVFKKTRMRPQLQDDFDPMQRCRHENIVENPISDQPPPQHEYPSEVLLHVTTQSGKRDMRVSPKLKLKQLKSLIRYQVMQFELLNATRGIMLVQYSENGLMKYLINEDQCIGNIGNGREINIGASNIGIRGRRHNQLYGEQEEQIVEYPYAYAFAVEQMDD